MASKQRLHFCVIAAIIYLTACEQPQPAVIPPVYYEAQLRAFVLSTPSLGEKVTTDSLQRILAKAAPDSAVFRRTISFLIEPFSSPNSSYRSQPLYAKLLTAEMQSNWYNADEKSIAQRKLTLSQQNTIGSVANDFPFTMPSGEVKRMYDLHTNFLLLYFNNPECEACKEMKAALAQSAVINQKIKTGELQVLSIYMETDKATWRSHLSEYPHSWLQGIGADSTLFKARIYDLTAIPTMYLLDKDKKVLLRDYFSVEAVAQIVK